MSEANPNFWVYNTVEQRLPAMEKILRRMEELIAKICLYDAKGDAKSICLRDDAIRKLHQEAERLVGWIQ